MKYRIRFLSLATAIFFLINAVCIGVNASSNSSGYTIGIQNITVYYIMNASSDRLLYADTSDTSDYEDVSTVSTLPSYWASDATKWELNRLSSGSFEIYGGAGYGAILKAIDDYDIETESNDGDNKSRFVINRSTASFEGTYTIMNNGKYLTLDPEDNSVYLKDSSPNTYSYWSLMDAYKGVSEFYTFNFSIGQGSFYNTSEKASNISDGFDELGYYCLHRNNYSNPSYVTTGMQNSDVFVFFGKGAPGELRFYGDNYSLYGQIMANSLMGGPNDYNQYFINNIPDNGLSQLRCVILLADNAGTSSGSYNMVDAIYNKGAHFVLGLTDSNMDTEKVSLWLVEFLTQLNKGINIEDALYMTNQVIDEEENYQVSYTYRGDDKQILKMG